MKKIGKSVMYMNISNLVFLMQEIWLWRNCTTRRVAGKSKQNGPDIIMKCTKKNHPLYTMEYLRKINEYVWILYGDRRIHQAMNGAEATRLMRGFIVDTSFKANGVQLRTDSLSHGYYELVSRRDDGCVFRRVEG